MRDNAGAERRERPVTVVVSVGFVVAVLIGVGLVGGIPTDEPGASMAAVATSEQQGNFEVTVESTSAPVAEGETVTVTAEIENTFDAGDTQEIVLEVGSIERDSTALTLQGGDSATVTLEWQTESGDAGDYEVVVSSADDSDATDVTVEEAAEEAFFAVTIDDTTEPVTEGDDLEVAATITNTGDLEGTQEITLAIAGSEVDAESVTLDGKQSESITLTWETEGGDAGDYEAVVSSADDSDAADVTAEELPEPAHFSVTILGVTSPVEPGDPITVEAEITNTGDEAGEQEIELLVEDDSVDDPVEVSLSGGDSETLTWETTIDEAGSFEFEVTSDDDADSTIVTVEEPPVGPQLEVAILDSTYDRETDRYTTRVRVSNTGDEPGSDEVELLIDGEPFPDPVVGEPAEPVEPGESTELDLTWANPDLEPGSYQLTTQAGADSDTADVTIELREEDVEPTEDDDRSLLLLGLAVGGVLVVTGAFLYRRRRHSTSTLDEPGDGELSTESVTEREVLAATTADRDEPPPDGAESESLRSVPAPPTGDDDCEDEAEEFAEMLNDLETAMADAATAEAEAEAAAERAQAAAEAAEEAADAAEEAEANLEEATDDRESTEERRDELPDEVEAAEEALEKARNRSKRRLRTLKRLMRERDEHRDAGRWTQLNDMNNRVLPEAREKLGNAEDAFMEAEETLESLEEELEEVEEQLEEAEEAQSEAETEAEAKREAADTTEAAAQEAAEAAEAAADAAEEAAETVDGLREDVMAAAEDYGDCIDGYLEELEELSEEAREDAEWREECAEEASEQAEEYAEEGDKKAEDAFPKDDPVSAAGDDYKDGRDSADRSKSDAEDAEKSADEAGGARDEAEGMRELLDDLHDDLSDRGLPGGSEVPTGDETAEKTRENAEEAEKSAESARRDAEEASALFSNCEEGETEPVDDEVYVEKTWKPHPSKPVEIEYGPWVYDGASDYTSRGQRVTWAIEGLATVFSVLQGDVDRLADNAIEYFAGDVDEDTRKELVAVIEFVVDESDVMPEINGKAGIPGEYYAALFSAAEDLLEGTEELRGLIRENRDKGDLEITLPTLVTERIYAVEMVCIEGRWVKQVGELIETETSEDTEWKSERVQEHEIPEKVRWFVDHHRNYGAEVKASTRSPE